MDTSKLLEYLRKHRLMTLSTYDEGPWVSTVYYAVHEDLNLYFISDPSSNHCQHIAKNPQISCAIADSRQKVTDKKTGVQLKGQVSYLADPAKIQKVLAMWNTANPGFEQVINFENMEKGVIKSKVYKITPTYIKFLNEELYGPEGFKEFKFTQHPNAPLVRTRV